MCVAKPVDRFAAYTNWDDSSAHYIALGPYGSTVRCAVEYVSLDASGLRYKRCFEASTTYLVYGHGFWLATGMQMRSGFAMAGWFGAYHGYDRTRANFTIYIAPPDQFDRTTAASRYLRMLFRMSSLGFSNGGVGYVGGWLQLTTPPMYSFFPANPELAYVGDVSGTVNVLFGYEDAWSDDWDQWAAVRYDAEFALFQATENPAVDVLLELDVGPDEVYIARWGGEVKLWVKRPGRGLVVPLGENVRITAVYAVSNISAADVNSPDGYEMGSGVALELETDKYDREKLGSTWLLYVLYNDRRDAYYIAYGDKLWLATGNEFYIDMLA